MEPIGRLRILYLSGGDASRVMERAMGGVLEFLLVVQFVAYAYGALRLARSL